MKRYVCNTKKDVHISVIITGTQDSERSKIAKVLKKAIQKMNRLSKHNNPSGKGVSYDIEF